MNLPPLPPGGPPELGVVNIDGSISIKRKGFCYQEQFDIDEKNRTVTCRKCGRSVDPIDALVDIAMTWDRFRKELVEYKRLTTEAEKNLDELRREIRNAKSRLRRAERRG